MSNLSHRTTRKTMSRHNAQRALDRITGELRNIIANSPTTDFYKTEQMRILAGGALHALITSIEYLYEKDQ